MCARVICRLGESREWERHDRWDHATCSMMWRRHVRHGGKTAHKTTPGGDLSGFAKFGGVKYPVFEFRGLSVQTSNLRGLCILFPNK